MAEDRINLEQSTVLLVDDAPQALDMLGSIFQGFGVKEQIKCPSAVEAVKILQQRPVDLIVIDCGDPEMDGYAFTRWLRRETPAPMRYTPVILVTGHASQSKVQEGRDCGVSQSWAWTGSAFVRVEQLDMSPCRALSSDFWVETYRSR